MNIKQTIIIGTLSIAVIGIFAATSVYAADCGGKTLKPGESCCGGVVTSVISCGQAGGKGAPIENTGLWGLLLLIINILTAGIGILAVGGVIYGSILYTTATDSVEQKKKAKTVIFNVIVGILAYALMYSFLNFIVPGGIFNQ